MRGVRIEARTNVGSPSGVAELLRRLAEAEARLRERDRDDESLGNLLGEIAQRDRRVRELEELVRGAGAVFDTVLDALRDRHGHSPDASELGDLLATVIATVDTTRELAQQNAQKIEQARDATTAMRNHELAVALDGSLGRMRNVTHAAAPVDDSVARVVGRLREIDKKERELANLRAALLEEVDEVFEGIRALRDAVGRIDGEQAKGGPRRAPSKLPKHRRA